eukprot:SM000022S07238  [mRNA]  locus=s22:737613:742418:+ [translate_table: standard]
MECGDVIYRATLPAREPFHLTTGGAALAALAAGYLWATPGVAPGFWDMFILGPLDNRLRPSYRKEDFVLGKKLGEGGYGTVYKATFANPTPGKVWAASPSSCCCSAPLVERKGHALLAVAQPKELVVKRANEFGAVEIWMNERVRRACASSCADFIYGFLEPTKGRNDEFWLVWKYEGDLTLASVLNQKDFPYNVEAAVLGRAQASPRGTARELAVVRELMRQILANIARLHATGIVHRDIKPQNIILCQETGALKIIDLGAAADLRVGINYVPREFLLDPRYAAPEQYIMSTQTPAAPPPAVATALSPVLWQMNIPDRFDVYSAGLILLQMVFPSLRSDSALIQFNRQFKRCNYDLAAWREACEKRAGADMQHGFELLEADGGAGWDLLQSMMRFKGRQRVSAGLALAHPFLAPGRLPLLQAVRVAALRLLQRDNTAFTQRLLGYLSKSGETGAMSEAQLQSLRQRERKARKSTLQRNALASALRIKRKLERTASSSLDSLTTGNAKPNNWWNRWES